MEEDLVKSRLADCPWKAVCASLPIPISQGGEDFHLLQTYISKYYEIGALSKFIRVTKDETCLRYCTENDKLSIST